LFYITTIVTNVIYNNEWRKKKRGFFVEKSPIGDTQFGDT
jgi:hypothetical protein